MRHPAIKISLLVLVTFALARGAWSRTVLQDNDTSAIDAFIAKQAKRLKGDEYGEARKVTTGDVNRDGVAETVVLFTIEGQQGSNNHTQYLAVFARSKSGLIAITQSPVGGKNWRSIEQVSVSDNAMQLDTLGYGPKDPSCCPSIKGTVRYLLVGKMLREQKPRKK